MIDKNGFISIKWHIDDVIEQAKNNGITLLRVQALDILEDVERHHDANYGITWETLDNAIEEYFRV